MTDAQLSSPRADEREDTVNMYLEFHYANTLDLFAKESFVPADALGFAERVTRRAVQLARVQLARVGSDCAT